MKQRAIKDHVLRAFTYSFVYDLSLIGHNKSALLSQRKKGSSTEKEVTRKNLTSMSIALLVKLENNLTSMLKVLERILTLFSPLLLKERL